MSVNTPLHNAFINRLNDLKKVADELPVSVIIHRLDTLQIIYMNNTGLMELGISLEALNELSPEHYHLKFFNEEDSKDYIPKVIYLVKSKREDERASFFQQVRTMPDGEWQLYVSNSRVFFRDDNGDATLAHYRECTRPCASYYCKGGSPGR